MYLASRLCGVLAVVGPKPAPAQSVLDLPLNTWSALAAAAQILSALGAIALLAVTLLSQRSAREANRHANRLAAQTEALVAATRAAQALAVRPVIELSFDSREHRLYVSNKGNGPLLNPQVQVNAKTHVLTMRDAATGEYRQLGALAAGTTAFSAVEGGRGPIAVTGWTMAGERYSGSVEIDGANSDRVLVAAAGPEPRGPVAEGETRHDHCRDDQTAGPSAGTPSDHHPAPG